MWRILIDGTRRRGTLKGESEAGQRIQLAEGLLAQPSSSAERLELDDQLRKLGRVDRDAWQVVMMRTSLSK